MLFAQATTTAGEIIGGVTNLGAVGIIGLFMLRILPAIAVKLVDGFRDGVAQLGVILKAERDSYEVRATKIAAEIEKIREQGGCRYQP